MYRAAAVFSLAAGMTAGSAAAADYWHKGLVRSVQVLSNGTGFILTFASDAPQCASTSQPKKYWFIDGQNGATTAGVPANLAAALTAKATGKPLSVFFSDVTTNCYISNTRVEE